MKNKEQKLSELISKIRELLPRLMKLEKGCLIRQNHNMWEVVRKVKHEGVLCVLRGNTQGVSTILDTDRILLNTAAYKIIGKEPTILNVLKCLDKIYPELYGISGRGLLIEYTYTSHYAMNSYFQGKETLFDLSKPYIKDLEEETINFLHSVLCL